MTTSKKPVHCHKCRHTMKRIEDVQGSVTWYSLECHACGTTHLTHGNIVIEDEFSGVVRYYPKFYLKYAREFDPDFMV